MDAWFVQNDDSAIVGPVSSKVLLEGIRAGRVPATARVRRAEDAEWSLLSTAEALGATSTTPHARMAVGFALAVLTTGTLATGVLAGRHRGEAEVRNWIARATAAEQKTENLERTKLALEARLRDMEESEEGMFSTVVAAAAQAESGKTLLAYAAAIATAQRFLVRFPDSTLATKVRDRKTALEGARATLEARTPTAVSFDELHKLAATGMQVGKPYRVCAWYHLNGLSQLCGAEYGCADKQISIESDFVVGTDQAASLYDRRGKSSCFEVRMFSSGHLAITGLR